MSILEVFFILTCLHFLADYPLQGEFLANGKNRKNPLPNIPWIHLMMAHCFIHGGMVYLVTESIPLAIIEIIIHGITDDAKCSGKINYNTDQLIHIICKLFYAVLITKV